MTDFITPPDPTTTGTNGGTNTTTGTGSGTNNSQPIMITLGTNGNNETGSITNTTSGDTLPTTGEADASWLSALGAILLSTLGSLVFWKKRQ